MQRGYTLLWRKTWDNPVLKERGKRYSRLEAWLYLVNVKAAGVNSESGLRRGEFEASTRWLAQTWNWGLGSVNRFLDDLEKNSMILKVDRSADRSPERYADRFIICNYDTYNPQRIANRIAEPIAQRNKVKEGFKEGFKEREITTPPAGAGAVDSLPSVESFRLSELLRKAIQVRDPNARAAKLPDTTHWARDIDKLIRLDGRRPEEIEGVIAWCQVPGCFWGPNILSGRKLRENFDTLWGQMQRDRGNGSKPKELSYIDQKIAEAEEAERLESQPTGNSIR